MNKKYIHVIFCILFLCISCRKDDTMSCVKDMLGSKIDICLDRMENISYQNNNDNVLPRYTMVCYFDSTECQTCASNKLYLWNKFMNKYDSRFSLDYVFIFNPASDSYVYLRSFLQSKKEKKNIFIDKLKIFEKRNSFVPKSSIYHTFLVNNTKKEIILVGDPRQNKKIEELFVNIITKQSSGVNKQ